MHIALFGGSFNPPHVAHQLVALYVLETAPVDAVWFVPCFRHAFDKPLEPFVDRLAMCERAASVLGSRCKVSAIESEIGGVSRTLVTVKALQKAYPEHRFSIVIGADLVAERKAWFGAEELESMVDWVIVGRRGSAGGEAASDAPGGSVEMPAISSSKVRAALAEGNEDFLERTVSKSVLAYIKEHALYAWPRRP
jgi:nicotinate-nucleotide adenylyltransferase